MSQKQHEIERLINPAISALGLELLGIEFSAGSSSALLRVYIDVQERAVNLDDCESASREISALLDVHDPIESHYTLEVSSPGIARPLFRPEHFARFTGESVKLEVDLPIDGRRRFQGPILRVDGDVIVLDQDGREIQIAHPNVIKAKLVPVYEAPSKPGKAPRDKPSPKASKIPASKPAKKQS